MALNEHQLASILKGLEYSEKTLGYSISVTDAIHIVFDLESQSEGYQETVVNAAWVVTTLRENPGVIVTHPNMIAYFYRQLNLEVPARFAIKRPTVNPSDNPFAPKHPIPSFGLSGNPFPSVGGFPHPGGKK